MVYNKGDERTPHVIHSHSSMGGKGLNRVTPKTVRHVSASVDFPQEPEAGRRINLQRTVVQFSAGGSKLMEAPHHAFGIAPLSPCKSPSSQTGLQQGGDRNNIPLPEFHAAEQHVGQPSSEFDLDPQVFGDMSLELDVHAENPLAEALEEYAELQDDGFVRLRTTQTTNDVMQEFADHRTEFIDVLLQREGCRDISECSSC